MKRLPRPSAAVILLCLLWPGSAVFSDPAGPPDFSITTLSSQLRFSLPTCLAFLPDGRLLVGEKAGRVYMVTNGVKSTPPLWDPQLEVLNTGDCGLVGIAVDPHYFVNHFVYFMYAVDPDFVGFSGSASKRGTPSSPQDVNDHGFGRLVRYTMSATDTNSLDPASRVTLFGDNWPDGPVITKGVHTVGALRFGADGTLLVSIGDGADAGPMDEGGCIDCADGYDPTLFGDGRTDPAEDLGAFRAQDRYSLAGKILRIDPNTGFGLPDNPYYDGNPNSQVSRVWAYGLRNPFRFTIRPGTGGAATGPGTLYIGDVGWATWEEIDIAEGGGRNFGWPCYEGVGACVDYQNAHPKSFACPTLDLSGRTSPLVSWSHRDSLLSDPPGLIGNCAIGGVFYSGSRYPQAYRGRYFFADYGANWLRTAALDSLDRLISLEPFATGLEGPTDFAVDPISGDICYVSIGAGEVRRISYIGASNRLPTAVAAAKPDSGRAPLTVQFSSAGSFDPEGSALTYRWSFGDRSVSDEADPVHVYDGSGVYSVVLSVSDSLGAVSRDTIRVTVTGPRRFPSTRILDGFASANGAVGAAWSIGGSALAIDDSSLVATVPGSTSAIWTSETFAADQEAYVTLKSPGEGVSGLLLEVAAGTPDLGAIEVRYAPALARVEVTTSSSSGEVVAGTVDVGYSPGDVLGARVYHEGVVQVFKNRSEVGEITLSGDMPLSGGRVGIALEGAKGAVLDDFGGGTILTRSDVPPIATITAPVGGSFFAAGDTIWLRGQALDENGTPRFRWQVDTHHNNHIHPGTFVSRNANDYFIAQSHDDGTGVFLRALLVVSDAGLSDSASVDLFPEVDLAPSEVGITSLESGHEDYRFQIANRGRMLAPYSRWVLVLDGTEVAHGDTLVPALDSVAIVVQGASPGEGNHTVRVTVDSLNTVHEIDETNNARVQTLAYQDSWTRLLEVPPTVRPYTMAALISWVQRTQGLGVVYYGSTPGLGDSVVARRDTTAHRLLLRMLNPESVYYYSVSIPDSDGNYHRGPVASFVTQPIPDEMALSPPFPNPTGGLVQFTIQLPEPDRVRFSVFDLQGRVVWTDRERNLPAGTWRLRWPGTRADGSSLRPGVYLARVIVGPQEYVRRILLVR